MNIPERIWKIVYIVGVFVVVVLAIGSLIGLKVLGTAGNNYRNQTPPTISVNGAGEMVAIPDVATFSFSVTETALTVGDAQTKAATKTNAAIKVLKDAGIAEKDIMTSSYSINPHYEYQDGICTQSYPSTCKPGKSVLTGYDVNEGVDVKVRDLTKAGSILTSIGGLGVQNVNGLSFSIDNADTLKDQARSKAITEAQNKADVLAQQLGVKLGRVISFNETGNQPVPIVYGMSNSMMEAKASIAVAPTIQTGEQKVTSNVSITYEIE